MREIVGSGDRVWTLIAVLGIALIGVSLALLFRPEEEMPVDAVQVAEAKVRLEMAQARKEHEALRAAVDGFIWRMSPDDVAAQALDHVNRQARSTGLTVVAFRPQRTTNSGGVLQQPFLVALEGRYPDVVSFARSLETTSTRLAVTTVQMSSADGGSDRVTATVGIVAFHEAEGTG